MKRIRHFLLIALLLLIATTNSGCFCLLAGGAAGYEVSPDSVKSSFDTSFSRAYRESLAVLRKLGKTTMEDEKGGWVKVGFDNYVVAAHIQQQTANSVKISVSARKFATPRSQKARDILDMIAARLK